MKIIVLGAGVIGVTTAYQLLCDGHEVVVVDRNSEAAAETSFANAGLIAPGHAYAWSSPKAPGSLLRSLWRDDQALRFRFSADPLFWRWCFLFLRQCTSERARINTLRKHKLCVYSHAAMRQVVEETGVAYDRGGGGVLYFYRTAESFERGAANTKILADDGQDLQVIERDRVVELDPSLADAREQIAGAIYCPTDESGDARLFSLNLAALCAERGVEFRYGTTVERLVAEGDRISQAMTDQGPLDADAYVLALGNHTAALVRPLGVRLPIYPVKGYSVTLPIDPEHRPPRLGGVDEDNLVAYARLGARLRVTATAEFAGYDTSHRPGDFTQMLSVARDLFPAGADYDRPSYWSCLRPMTPEGAPIFGRGALRNLVYNCGHGHMGWTMACGAARITADLIAERATEIDLVGMTLR